MDKLEEHIRKNREDLDRYSPPKGIWRSISKKINNRKSQFRQWLSIAAIITVIAGTAVIFLRPEIRSANSSTGKADLDDLSHAIPQLKETESYYNNMVNMLYKEAVPLLTNNPEIKKELNSDLSHLDSICADIRKDLKDNISNQDVVEALIQNYRIKIHILEEMLTVLKENDTIPEKIKSHEL